jgi:HEAT repeats/HEAT repeat
MKSVLALVAFAALVGSGRADEADEDLARKLAAVVRDPRRAAPERVDAAQSLEQLGPKAIGVLDELTKQLRLLRGREQESLQEAVLQAIGAMGPSAKGALPDLARVAGRGTDVDLALKSTKAKLLADATAFDLQSLFRQLESRDGARRLGAAKTLGRRGDAAALPALTKALADADADVRRACVEAIRKIAPNAKPSKELIQAYVADLTDPDDAARLAAVRALGKLGAAAAEAGGAIQNLAADPDKDVRKAAADALAKLAGP